MTLNKYSKFIKSRREKLHLSQSFVADKLGYSSQIISSWERGLSLPNMSIWQELIDILQIDIDGFIKCKPINNIKGYKFDENKFAYQLKDLRIQNQLTQGQLASSIGVNIKTVSSWENGTSLPSIDIFVALADIFKVSYSHLFYGEEVFVEIKKTKTKKKWSLARKIVTGAVSLTAALGVILPIVIIKPWIVRTKTNTVYVDPHTGENIDPPVTDYSLTFDTSVLTLHEGENYQINYKVNPSNAEIVWVSSNIEVAKVSNSGYVTPIERGKTLITAYLKLHTDIKATCDISVKFQNYIADQEIFPGDKKFLEFYKPNEKHYATFYFEDKKTMIYREQFYPDDDFVYNFVEPKFGPFKGWEYEFLGWDYNDDGVVDNLPDHIEDNMDFVAVYNKTPTQEQDSIAYGYNNHQYICYALLTKGHETEISWLFDLDNTYYAKDIEASDLYKGINLKQSMQQFEYLIALEGTTKIYTGNFNYSYISTPKTCVDLVGVPDGVTFCDGLICAQYINIYTFEGSVKNKMIRYYGAFERCAIGTETFVNCENIEYFVVDGIRQALIDLKPKAFPGCINLKTVLFNRFVFCSLGAFIGSGAQYLDLSKNCNYQSYEDDDGNESKLIYSNSEVIDLITRYYDSPTVDFFEPSHFYNVYAGYAQGSPGDPTYQLDSDVEHLTNVNVYYYSEIARENGWHWNSDGFPTLIY